MSALKEKIDNYYTGKLKEFGNTAKGVDWKDETSQQTRFEQLSKVIDAVNFSVLDYGCGYGAFYNYLKNKNRNFKYTGYDIAAEMILAAKQNIGSNADCFLTTDETALPVCDYAVASGIFNVRLDIGDAEWQEYIEVTLQKINKLVVKGFSFNMLPSYADEHLKKNYLYYANPEWVKKICAGITTNEITILNDYGLFEFTVLIKK